MKKLSLLPLTLLGFYGVSAFGSEEPIEELEVTATVIKDQASFQNVPRHTLTRRHIETVAAASVVDLLRTVPGINVTQQGGKGGLTFVSLRGGESNFTVVIIDGVKVNDINNSRGGGYDFVGLDPQLIQRIDVYFGGLSPVFGSEALGGVISITTLNAQIATRSVTLEAGSHNQHGQSFHLAAPLADKMMANVSGAWRDGGDAVEGDSLIRKQLNFKLNSMAGSKVDWKLNFFHNSGDSSAFPEDSGGDQLAVIRQPEERQFEQNNIAGAVNWSVNELWDVTVTAAFAEHREDINSPGIFMVVPPVLTDSQYRRADVGVTNIFSVSSKTTLGIGLESAREEGRFDSIIDFGVPVPANFSIDRNIYAVFSEIRHQATDNLSLTAGLRYDDADGIDETTYRLASSYRVPSTGTELVFQYGEGFKLPSFFALGHPLVGNASLQPEFSENTSLAVEQSLFDDKVIVSASYFYNEFSNLVDFDPESFTNVNRSRIVAKGSEFRVTLIPATGIKASGYVTYTDYDADQGVKLRRRPPWSGGLSLLWQPNERHFVNMQASYVNQFYDSWSASAPIKLDGYSRVDTSFGWQVTNAVMLKFIINNLLDEEFEETVGFSNPGRELRVSLTTSF